jgi:hypothetical protein
MAFRCGLFGVGLVLLTWLGAGGPATADHSGTLQLNDRVGPYIVSVWTQPERPRTDNCQIGVVVMQDHLRAVSDAVVRLRADRADGAGPAVAVTATHGRGPLYETALRLPTPGRWTVTVDVSGPAGAGRASFPLDVEAASWGWRAWLLVAIAIALLAGVGLALARRRRAPAPA